MLLIYVLCLLNQVSLFSVQLCDKTVQEINSSESKIPIAEVSFTLKQPTIVLTQVTKRKEKQTVDATFRASEHHRGHIGCVTLKVKFICIYRFPLSPGSLLTTPRLTKIV